MVKIFKIAEDRALLSQAFQEVVLDCRFVILVFKHDDECSVEIFWPPRNSIVERVLAEAESSAQREQCHTSTEPRDSQRFVLQALRRFRRQTSVKGWISSNARPLGCVC